MHLMMTIFALFGAITLAAPVLVPNANEAANINHKISLPTSSNANPLSIRQDMQCDWDGFCADAFEKCVQTCDSLKDADW